MKISCTNNDYKKIIYRNNLKFLCRKITKNKYNKNSKYAKIAKIF